MKNLFKNLFQPAKEEPYFADAMEIVTNKYPKVVQEIHHEFLTAGDKLLASANEIIANTNITNEAKSQRLKDLGFFNTKEVLETSEQIKKKEDQQKIALAISEFRKDFPNHKFITKDAVMSICKKYDLVLGLSGQFKGFIPNKNLTDIEMFFKDHPKEEFEYFMGYSNHGSFEHKITEKEYSSYQYQKEYENKVMLEQKTFVTRGLHNSSYRPYYRKSKTILSICAPLKDMDTKGYTLKDRILVKEVPDPIVLLPKKHTNGVDGYIIITAWGDEARDPLVLNEKLN